MKKREISRLTRLAETFVQQRDELRALAVCGSWARGDARPDSDLDVLIIAREPARWRRNQKWLRDFPWGKEHFAYRSHRTATYGVVWSAHVALEPQGELELTFAPESWASIAPIDQGTRRVVADAFHVVVDKDGSLCRLVKACRT